jgi:hypothetical protein
MYVREQTENLESHLPEACGTFAPTYSWKRH